MNIERKNKVIKVENRFFIYIYKKPLFMPGYILSRKLKSINKKKELHTLSKDQLIVLAVFVLIFCRRSPVRVLYRVLTGSEVPYRDRWNYHCRRHPGCTDIITFHKIDTGMEIKPVIVGDRANIEITPRISHIDSSDPRGVVRFSAAATRLSIPLGQWVTIGGVDKSSNEILREILAGNSGKADETLSMSLMVETY